MNLLRNLPRLAGGIFFNIPENISSFSEKDYISVCLRSGIFVFLVIDKVIHCPLEESESWHLLRHFFHSAQETRVFLSECVPSDTMVMKNRSRLWLDKRFTLTVVLLSDWLVACFMWILRALFIEGKSQYVFISFHLFHLFS